MKAIKEIAYFIGGMVLLPFALVILIILHCKDWLTNADYRRASRMSLWSRDNPNYYKK